MTTEQVILSAILTLTASSLTAFLTSKITRDNEMRKIIHQKRLELYLEVFEQVELLLKDWKKIFDKEYFEKIASYKSRIKLLASEKTTEEYKKYYEALRTSVNAYKNSRMIMIHKTIMYINRMKMVSGFKCTPLQ